MQKSFKLAALAGALSLAMGGGSAMAASFNYGGWTATNGAIDITNRDNGGTMCTSDDFECSTIAEGDGFMQVQVSQKASSTATPAQTGLEAGESFIMTIVTDQNATGVQGVGADGTGFSDVSFVKMKINLGGSNSNVNGIAAQQLINEKTGTSQFDSATNINTGWANTTGVTPVTISQNVVDNGFTTSTGDDFSSGFNYAHELDTDPTSSEFGRKSGFTMSIDQTAGLESAAQAGSANDVQSFALRQRNGTMLGAANVGTGTATLGGNTGGTVTWAAGEDIKAIWLGQKVNLGSAATLAGALGSNFGYLAFDNTEDSTSGGGTVAPITEFGFGASNADSAWEWDGAALNVGDGEGTPNVCDPSGATLCP